MEVTRRDLIGWSAATALIPSACRALARPGLQVSPEAFGAIGDGVSDDYDAFVRMAAAVNGARGGTVTLRPGATYYLGRYVTDANRVTDLTFQNCSGLVVEGNGAAIAVKGDFSRGTRTTRSLCGLRLENCVNVVVRNLQLIGNVQLTRRSAGIAEAPSHGLLFGGCSDVMIDGVTARHFECDGLYIRYSTNTDLLGRHTASRRFQVRNSRFLFNARQGLSVIQLRDATFDNCDFGFSGYINEEGGQGVYGWHAPGASVDVEPNATAGSGRMVDVITGNLRFSNCKMRGSYGGGFLAGQYAGCMRSIEAVTLDHCEISCNPFQQEGRYGFIFDVEKGVVSNCILRMYNKSAFIGWYPDNDASVTFIGNTIYGNGASNPVFVVRPTRGAPLVEGNTIFAQMPSGTPRNALVRIENPRGRLRNNTFQLPPSSSPVVVMNAASAEGNEYRAPHGAYPITYGQGTATTGERYVGGRPMRAAQSATSLKASRPSRCSR